MIETTIDISILIINDVDVDDTDEEIILAIGRSTID